VQFLDFDLCVNLFRPTIYFHFKHFRTFFFNAINFASTETYLLAGRIILTASLHFSAHCFLICKNRTQLLFSHYYLLELNFNHTAGSNQSDVQSHRCILSCAAILADSTCVFALPRLTYAANQRLFLHFGNIRHEVWQLSLYSLSTGRM
jgi:hypothetical protein